MREIKANVTLYWEIPDELTNEQMIEVLQKLSMERQLELVTSIGFVNDELFEVNK